MDCGQNASFEQFFYVVGGMERAITEAAREGFGDDEGVIDLDEELREGFVDVIAKSGSRGVGSLGSDA